MLSKGSGKIYKQHEVGCSINIISVSRRTTSQSFSIMDQLLPETIGLKKLLEGFQNLSVRMEG